MSSTSKTMNVLDIQGHLIKFFVEKNYVEDEEIETFEVLAQSFDDLIQKIMEKKSVECNDICLSFKNELVFFDGSNQEGNIIKDVHDLFEIIKQEKNAEGTIELIYKNKTSEVKQEENDEYKDDDDDDEMEEALTQKQRVISSSEIVEIITTVTGYINATAEVQKTPRGFNLKRKRMFSPTCELWIVFKSETDENGKTWNHVWKYEIPSNIEGLDKSEDPIFIQVVNGIDNEKEFVIKVNNRSISGIPQYDKIPGPTEWKHGRSGKVFKFFGDSVAVTANIFRILESLGVIP